MFKSITNGTRLFSGRLFSTTTKVSAPSSKASRKSAKSKLMRYNTSPQTHPLYMPVQQALKYLRAHSVGQPYDKQSIVLQLAVNQDKGAHPLNGNIQFPHPVIQFEPIVFTSQQDKIETLKQQGIRYVGGSELIEQIRQKEINLDTLTHAFATPEIMDKLKTVARSLGPKGLMPNAKKETVTDDINKMFQLSGQYPFKQRNVNLNLTIGNCSFSDVQILENLHEASKAIYEKIDPKATKKTKLGKCRLHTSQSPSIVIDFQGLLN